MKSYHFSIFITQDENGTYMARVPSLPGCHTQAKTMAKLYERIEEAIELCLEVEKSKKGIISQEQFVGLQQIEVTA